jgi:hypothetical protein
MRVAMAASLQASSPLISVPNLQTDETAGYQYFLVDGTTGYRQRCNMHTVVETPPYLAAADEAGLSDEEREAIKDMLARNPIAGDVIVGTGGCRKVRVAGRGKGKSGGYRVITFFTGPELPVFLITVFGKGERTDLTQRERNALAGMTKQIADGYRRKVAKLPRR